MGSQTGTPPDVGPGAAETRSPASLTPRQRRVFALVGTVALCFGVYLGAGGVIDGWRHVTSAEWPSVSGEFEGVERRGERRYASLVVAYRYRVKDREHRGDRIAFVEDADAREFVLRLKPGQSVTVSYHPDDHANSVLIPGSRSDLWRIVGLVLVTGGIPLAIAVVFLVASWKMSRRHTSQPAALGNASHF